MIDASDVERFVKDPSLLVELCHDVIEQIDARSDDTSVKDKEAQLLAISQSIEQLSKVGVPVPDALRAEKTRLVADLGFSVEASQTLNHLTGEFEEILKDLKARIGRSGNVNGAKKLRGKRSSSPKTGQLVLRENIILALQKLGGRSRLEDVIVEVGKQLEGKLLTGDIEWRESTNDYAWQKNTKWERFRMTQDGTLRNDSPRGVWELNEDSQ